MLQGLGRGVRIPGFVNVDNPLFVLLEGSVRKKQYFDS